MTAQQAIIALQQALRADLQRESDLRDAAKRSAKRAMQAYRKALSCA